MASKSQPLGLPVGAWDSHIHIIDTARYTQTSDTPNTPITASVWENCLYETALGVDKVTIIQPTRYDNNNTATLQALAAYGPERARAVVQFNPDNIEREQLQQWHDMGVRGVRINFANPKNPISDTPPEEIPQLIQKYSTLIKPFGWVLQFFIRMHHLILLKDILPKLGVRTVLDHLAYPKLPSGVGYNQTLNPYALEGFEVLAEMLKAGKTWIKISAPYRITDQLDPEYQILDPLIEEILRIDSSKALFGTDWPHTSYETVDLRPWVNHLRNLTGADSALQKRLFRDNAINIWNVE